jgi:hypothetical protein
MATPILCNGGMSFVTVSAMGGTEPYMGTGNFEVSAGTYLYNVVDVNGCQAVVEVIVAEPEVLLAFAQAAPIICNGGITDVSVSATGGTLPYFGTGAFEVSAGTYSYTVTDANNCSDVVEIVVNQPDELTISVDFNPILCNGDLTNLYVNYQGGTGQVSFEWSTGVTGSQLLNVIAGSYYVTATDAFGCQTILEVSVLEQTSLNLVLNMNTVSCFGAANGTVITNVSGGITSYSYLWNTGATSPNIVGLAPGFYSLTVIDANQCSVSGQVQVTQPLPLYATAIKNNVTCFGASTGSINLTMGGGTLPYSFLWNNQATTEDLNDLPAGNYSVIITDASGCVYNYSTTIIQPSNVSITVNTIPASCFGTATGSVDISVSGATPPYSYFWNTFAVSQDIVSVLAGTYQVSVTDANQCQFVAVGIVSEPVALALNLTATNTSAPGISDGSVDLSVSGGTLPYSYLWNNGTINQDLAGVPAGIYDVTVTDSNGCMEFGSAEVEETPLLPASWNITPSAIIHQIDIPLSALISWYGQPLVYGDYIGVFFNHGAGEVCGGYAKWEGLATTLNAFGDPSGLNGFLEGDQFSWKIWVQSSLTDHDASATYTPVGGAITHTGIFANGGYSQLASLYAYQTQNISVKNNWYISTYLMPVNTNMVSIFAPIASSVQLVKDENGKVYWISYGVNQIGAWLKNKAYQVKLITPSATINLQITGIPIIPQNELISLKSGWNYLGYTRQSNGAIASMLSPISGQIVQVKNSLGQIYLPSNVFNPYPFNSIGNMIPGQGYYIKMGSLSSFSYPANSSYALPAKLLEVSSVHFKDIMNTGQNMVLGIPESAWSEMPSLNDEIGVFNAKDELVGSSVYTGGLTMITIWGEGSLASEKRGMAEGEELTLKVWNSTDFSENLLTVSAFVDGDGKYHTDVVYFVDKLQKIDNLASASIILGQNYPNPFNGSTEIAFSLPEEANVNIEVYNAMGELIETHKLGNVLAGSHQFILDAADYSSGSYFYVLNAGGLRQTRSMNIIK